MRPAEDRAVVRRAGRLEDLRIHQQQVGCTHNIPTAHTGQAFSLGSTFEVLLHGSNKNTHLLLVLVIVVVSD